MPDASSAKRARTRKGRADAPSLTTPPVKWAVPSPGATRPDDDRLLLLPEVAELSRRSEATLRWLRHVGGDDAPPLWRQGRRLVAWRSEVLAWLDRQREAASA